MDIMINIETMGAKDDAAILSIGAAIFNENGVSSDKIFYRVISLEHNLDIGRTVDASTIMWWLEQSEEARAELSKGSGTLHAAMMNLYEFVQMNLTKKGNVWVNGAMFDFRILRNAYMQMGTTPPWRWNQECCMRALRRIEKYLPASVNIVTWDSTRKLAEKNNKVAHNALEDALLQAHYVQQYLSGFKE